MTKRFAESDLRSVFYMEDDYGDHDYAPQPQDYQENYDPAEEMGAVDGEVEIDVVSTPRIRRPLTIVIANLIFWSFYRLFQPFGSWRVSSFRFRRRVPPQSAPSRCYAAFTATSPEPVGC